jgi:hypothetical protein
MPSHTYYWVGRYEDAAKVNMRAVEIGIENAKNLGLPAPNGVWGLPYHAHNVTFGLGGALQAGDAEIALRLGRPLVERSQIDKHAGAYRQMIAANGYYAMAIFADPKEVLALPKPNLPFLEAAWHYARGEAYAKLGDAGSVRKEAAAIHGVSGEGGRKRRCLEPLHELFRRAAAGMAAMAEIAHGRDLGAAMDAADHASLSHHTELALAMATGVFANHDRGSLWRRRLFRSNEVGEQGGCHKGKSPDLLCAVA